MQAVAIPGTAYVRANHGRWIADCVSPLCTSAMRVDVGQGIVTCWDCGRGAPLAWPPDPVAVEHILAMRADPRTRNWDASETLEDLLLQNAEHGELPASWRELTTTTPIMLTADEVVVGGLLAEALPPASERLMIGA